MDNIKLGEPLSLKEFAQIITTIQEPGEWPFNKQNIKYVRPALDLRDNKIFNIKFDSKEFDFRHGEGSMFDQIMKWINEDQRSR
jgi:hypothetical protein